MQFPLGKLWIEPFKVASFFDSATLQAPLVTRREQLGTDDNTNADKPEKPGRSRGRGRGRGRGRKSQEEPKDNMEEDAVEEPQPKQKQTKRKQDEDGGKSDPPKRSRSSKAKQQGANNKTDSLEGKETADNGKEVETDKGEAKEIDKGEAKEVDKVEAKETDKVEGEAKGKKKTPSKNSQDQGKPTAAKSKTAPKRRTSKPADSKPPVGPKDKLDKPDKSNKTDKKHGKEDKGTEGGPATWAGRWIPTEGVALTKFKAIQTAFNDNIAHRVKAQSSLQSPFFKVCNAAFKTLNANAEQGDYEACAKLQVEKFLATDNVSALVA